MNDGPISEQVQILLCRSYVRRKSTGDILAAPRPGCDWREKHAPGAPQSEQRLPHGAVVIAALSRQSLQIETRSMLLYRYEAALGGTLFSREKIKKLT